ncbi:MAG: EAL domain-containing protein [Lachnospiraceae bacterium]|nr:EAL domain-containing protein [Lachnospiraceae bacterium]
MDINEKEKKLLAVKEAYKKKEIRPYYQPQYDAVTNKIISAEALTRWIKADGTMVLPVDYIPFLEESNAILELDWYMLDAVCDMLKRQREQRIPSVPIAVNFSRRHILEGGFVELLCETVNRYGISHRLIKVELTESTFIDNTDEVERFANSVREAGFSISIDDFGSGLSSLSLVKDISIDELKLDRALLSRNCEDEKERIVLESILTFAHRLKLVTVAEGVETSEQLGFLRTCGCKVIQGYLFAKPMPEQEFWQLCLKETQDAEIEDILKIQAVSSAHQLLIDAIFMRYPLVIFSNLTRNSYYMMTYENFSATSCAGSGVFEELIQSGSMTMHPEDQERFRTTFSIENQLAAYARGEKVISLITKQLGDDGIYRRVETSNYFVKHPSVDDVLVISLCHNLD